MCYVLIETDRQHVSRTRTFTTKIDLNKYINNIVNPLDLDIRVYNASDNLISSKPHGQKMMQAERSF